MVRWHECQRRTRKEARGSRCCKKPASDALQSYRESAVLTLSICFGDGDYQGGFQFHDGQWKLVIATGNPGVKLSIPVPIPTHAHTHHTHQQGRRVAQV